MACSTRGPTAMISRVSSSTWRLTSWNRGGHRVGMSNLTLANPVRSPLTCRSPRFLPITRCEPGRQCSTSWPRRPLARRQPARRHRPGPRRPEPPQSVAGDEHRSRSLTSGLRRPPESVVQVDRVRREPEAVARRRRARSASSSSSADSNSCSQRSTGTMTPWGRRCEPKYTCSLPKRQLLFDTEESMAVRRPSCSAGAAGT